MARNKLIAKSISRHTLQKVLSDGGIYAMQKLLGELLQGKDMQIIVKSKNIL